jgi:hypothetical protein
MRRFAWGMGLAALIVGGLAAHAPMPASEPASEPSVQPLAVTRPDSSRAAESWQTRVRFDFAGGITSPPREMSGKLSLTEVTSGGGELIQMPHGDDWAVHFPLKCWVERPEDCPRAILESGPADFLNPGERRFRWGASVMIMPNEMSEGSNVLQKGLSASGTQYKLQVDGYEGRPSCAITTEQGKFLAVSRIGIADSEWHRLACERSGQTLILSVDSEQVATATLPPGLSIANGHPLRIGGKGNGPFNDQFHGTIDDVFVDIG